MHEPTAERRTGRERWIAALVLVLTALCGAFVAARIEVTSDITHFLPDDSDALTGQVLRGLTASSAAQRLVILIGGAEPPVLVEASARMAAELSASPAVARVEREVSAQAQSELFQLYFPRRYGLFSTEPERDYAALLSDAGLARAASELVRKLGSAEAPLIRGIAAGDPLLIFPRVMARLDAARRGGLSLRDGVFFTNDGARAVLLVTARASVLDAPGQRALLDAVERARAAAAEALRAPLAIEKSGVGRYSVHAERAVRSDIERISIWSTAVVVLLAVLFLRSLRALVVVLIPTVAAAVAACAVTLAVFGRIHGMTLAFGTTLLGVCSDYAVHFIGHHLLADRREGGLITMRRIWPAIRLGGLTSVAGLLGLGVAGFPGIRELALFSGTGVLASLVATRYLAPVALGLGGGAPALTRASAAGLARAIRAIERRAALSWAVLGVALALCIAGLTAVRFQDDLASWVPMPQALRAEDERVNAALSAMDPGKLIVISGANEQALLEASDRVAAVLDGAIERGELGDYRSLRTLLWSRRLQERNLAALKAAPDLAARALAAFEEAGVDSEQLAPFARDLASLPRPMSLRELITSPLAPIASGFMLRGDRGDLLLVHLRGVQDEGALERALAAVPGARYFDQRAVLGATYGAFRERTFQLLAAGLVAVLGMVLARYRSLRRSVAAVLPAVLASAATLALLSIVGVQLDLFHVLGVLLVLSMGEDYGVFLVESDGGEDLPATALGIVLASVTTVASFGLLAMSDIPALRSLGQMVSLGVLLATVFAPAGLVLLPRRRGAA